MKIVYMMQFSSLLSTFYQKQANQLNTIYAETDSVVAVAVAAAAALFLAKYSSARARFFATDGLTHFFRPGNTVREEPAASSFSFADAEKARALKFSFTFSSPSPRI